MAEKNKKVKLAVLRDDRGGGCPFGLPIPFGCKNAGELIRNMAPVSIMGEDSTEEEAEQISAANNFIFMWHAPEERCKYAAMLFKDKPIVECNWDENTAGIREISSLVGSPYYYKHFSGTSMDGLYSYPLGFYTDNSIDRGLYYGMYSLESTGSEEEEPDELIKSNNK